MRYRQMLHRGDTRDRESGQVLALFALGLLTLVAGVALVIDGGNAYANQRVSQNASDAAAQAGALVIAEVLGGADKTDDDVRSAIAGVLTAMEMNASGSRAEYTRLDGTRLGVEVGKAPDGIVPSTASGVAVAGRRDFGTFFARVLGMGQLTATTEATAVAGWTRSLGTNLLPVTPPLNIVTCDKNGDIALANQGIWVPNTLYRVPLCKNGPGEVGWIDWDPPAGGNDELEEEIRKSSGSITVPSWQFIAQTGRQGSAKVEEALRAYDGMVVRIPLFDSTCDNEPNPDDSSVAACPEPNVGGHGQNQWYHIADVGFFQFCPGDPTSTNSQDMQFAKACADKGLSSGAYVSGTNKKECDTGNGATQCLAGRFVYYLLNAPAGGSLTSVPGPSKALSVQLIK